MVTSAFISQLRRQFNDKPVLHQDQIAGDGTSTVYAAKFAPIKEGSSELAINNVLKVLDTDYTLDYDTGDIELTSATSNAISHTYKQVKFRDAEWLDAVVEGHRALGDQFFKAVLFDRSAMSLSAGVQKYSCPANCIRLLKVFESSNYTSGGVYVPLKTNWEYNRRSNELVISQKPAKNNFLAVSYLRRVTPPSAASMSLDVEDNWLAMIGHKAGAYYLRSLANKIAQQGNATVEEGHFNVQALRVLATDEEQQFELLRKRIKPLMPNLEIPYWDPSKGVVPA